MSGRSSFAWSVAVAAVFGFVSMGISAETLPPLADGASPQTLDAVWGDYDPSREPLDTEVHKEWVEQGTELRAVRYCIGTFKGQEPIGASLI